MPLLSLAPLSRRVTKGDVLHFLQTRGGIDRRLVGRIEIEGSAALVEVPEAWAERLVRGLDGEQLGDRRVRVQRAGGGEDASDPDREDHFSRLLHLLELEGRAEERQTAERVQRLPAGEAERSGLCLAGLMLRDEYCGLGGHWVVTLGKRDRSRPLPWTRLQAGAPVLLTGEDTPGFDARGVVSERGDDFVRVALNQPEPSEETSGSFRLDLAPDDAAGQRQRTALEQARAARRDRLAELRAILLDEATPRFGDEVPLVPLDTGLNASQREAVRFALSARDVAILHGPPGTGKTTTVVEVIRQAVRRGDRVLVCAPSNLAVDNLLERLLAGGERVVRLGHPARVLPELRAHTLDVLVEEHSDSRLARKFTRDAFALFRQASKWTRAKPEPGARRDIRQEARALLVDARRLEGQAIESVLGSAAILCATTTGLDAEVLGKRTFDLAVIDEACQSTEPGCWIPLLRSQRIILAGDHCQLPPTVLSPEAAKQGFSVSLLERLVARYGAAITRRLDVQYRMHEEIMGFSSLEFYHGSLQADATVRGHRLCDLPGVAGCPLTESPVEFIDTAGAGYEEEVEPDGESRRNEQEARLVERKVRALLEAGVAAEQMGVITPYAAQVRRLRELLPLPGLEIDSVDGFQGREKEAIVLSLVRSNAEGEIGFLADVRRTNVALTRARRKVLVIGDSATLSALPFYQRLFEYFETIGAYRTVWEEEV
ncbi:MAG: AAA family ATPase [Planctomycetes bacterium]|nr:AAA family ATPase [Planctomycetota bacterium]